MARRSRRSRRIFDSDTVLDPNGDWRSEVASFTKYKRVFAWLPVTLENGEKVWFKKIYRVQVCWTHDTISLNIPDHYLAGAHPDKPTYISEADYICRKLTNL